MAKETRRRSGAQDIHALIAQVGQIPGLSPVAELAAMGVAIRSLLSEMGYTKKRTRREARKPAVSKKQASLFPAGGAGGASAGIKSGSVTTAQSATAAATL